MIRQSCSRYASRLLGGALLVFSCVALFAAAREPMLLTSASKQFIVRGLPQSSVFAGAKSEVVYVDPPLLIVICERIKEALHEELGWKGRWRGTIFINVHPVQTDNETLHLTATRSSDGWRYRLDLPDETERRRLVQSIIEVLLLEFANRSAGDKSAELPPWLAEGITEHMMHGPLFGLAFQPNTIFVRHRVNNETSAELREKVQAGGGLTVDALNWPEFDARDVNALQRYRTSAHLFVRELLRLRGGPDCLSATLALLPEHLNWQTAFLRGFDPHFKRMLDTEKWWSLVLVRTQSREQSALWSSAESRAKLEEVIFTPMEVRITKAELPHMMPVSLQTVIGEWDFKQQDPLLRAKIAQLQALRVRVQPDIAALANDYRAALESYLHARRAVPSSEAKRPGSASVKVAVAGALRELKNLDERLEKLTSAGLVTSSGAVPLTHP